MILLIDDPVSRRALTCSPYVCCLSVYMGGENLRCFARFGLSSCGELGAIDDPIPNCKRRMQHHAYASETETRPATRESFCCEINSEAAMEKAIYWERSGKIRGSGGHRFDT